MSTQADTTDVTIEALEGWSTEVLVSVGLRRSDAEAVAANLAFAETRGVSTHGLLRLPTYVERIRAGGINRAADVTIDTDLGGFLVIDAHNGPGASTGRAGVDLAIDRAMRFGIGCVIARNANHFGASAHFSNRIADAGMLGLTVCNTESVMCAPFGGRPVLGTNPLAVAIPLPADSRAQLDMATSTVSQGKLLMARQAGESIPLGWAVDARGQGTTSPTEGLAGALLPSGGPKGFGLAFVVDALLALGGANLSPDVSALNGDPSVPQGLGHLFLAIRADAVGSLAEYRARMSRLVQAIHESGVDGSASPPMAPGEPELARTQSLNGRVRLSGETLLTLQALADSTGVPVPAAIDRLSGSG